MSNRRLGSVVRALLRCAIPGSVFFFSGAAFAQVAQTDKDRKSVV